MSTQRTSTDSDAGALQNPALCKPYSLFDNVTPFNIEAVWGQAEDVRVKLSERTTRILLALVAYSVIFQGLNNSCQVSLLSASQCQGVTYTDHRVHYAKHLSG